MKIKMSKVTRLYTKIFFAYLFMSCAFVLGFVIYVYFKDKEGFYPYLPKIFLILMWLFFLVSYLCIYAIKLNMASLVITKNKIRCTCLFMKPIEYEWGEVVSCGMDYFSKYSKQYKMIYISKKQIPSLDYSNCGHLHVNSYWKNFVRENGVHKSLQKERELCLRFEIDEKELVELKTYLPKHLLVQLEESEARLFEHISRLQ